MTLKPKKLTLLKSFIALEPAAVLFFTTRNPDSYWTCGSQGNRVEKDRVLSIFYPFASRPPKAERDPLPLKLREELLLRSHFKLSSFLKRRMNSDRSPKKEEFIRFFYSFQTPKVTRYVVGGIEWFFF